MRYARHSVRPLAGPLNEVLRNSDGGPRNDALARILNFYIVQTSDDSCWVKFHSRA
jgi:hypothetical protein